MRASTSAGLSIFRLTAQHVRLLKRRQVLFLNTSDQIVTLLTGVQNGTARNTVVCHLSPAAFRVLGILILAAPDVTSYPMLYAGLYCSNECFEALLATGSLLAPEFQTEVAQGRKRLGALSETEFERQVQPVRYAMKSVKYLLRRQPFGWMVENRYGQGYLLTEAPPL
jgi:hypothetical protein